MDYVEQMISPGQCPLTVRPRPKRGQEEIKMRAAPGKIATFVVILVALALWGPAYAADRTTNMAVTAMGSSTQDSPFVNALYVTGNGPKFELAHFRSHFRSNFRSFSYSPYYRSYTYYPSSYYLCDPDYDYSCSSYRPYASAYRYVYPFSRHKHFRTFRHFRR